MIVAYEPDHLARLSPAPDAVIGLRHPGVLDALGRIADLGLCETILTEDGATVLGIMGAIPISPSTCEVLVVSSEDQKRFPVLFSKSVRKRLSTLSRDFANIQAIGEDSPFLARWFSWLGFSCDGPVDRPEFEGRQMLMWRSRA